MKFLREWLRSTVQVLAALLIFLTVIGLAISIVVHVGPIYAVVFIVVVVTGVDTFLNRGNYDNT
jgi:hypothetical protein